MQVLPARRAVRGGLGHRLCVVPPRLPGRVAGPVRDAGRGALAVAGGTRANRCRSVDSTVLSCPALHSSRACYYSCPRRSGPQRTSVTSRSGWRIATATVRIIAKAGWIRIYLPTGSSGPCWRRGKVAPWTDIRQGTRRAIHHPEVLLGRHPAPQADILGRHG